MKLNNLDLNKLKCFHAIAEKGSLLSGAKHLNLTPSAVYQSVKKLEEDINTHLFFRSGKKYVLTDEGRALRELYERFLWDLSEFQDKSLTGGNAFEGKLRIGLPLNFSKSSFIPLMKKFLNEHSNVQFFITIAETNRLIDQISAFELDFAITDDSIKTPVESKITKREIMKEELVLVASRNLVKQFPEAFKSVKAMKELPHLDYTATLPLIQRWYKLHYKRQVKINQHHVIDNVETMLAAIREGIGIGIIPKSLYSEKDFHLIEFQNTQLLNPLYLVQESNFINNRLLKKFIQFMETNL